MKKVAMLAALLMFVAAQAVSDSPDKKYSEFVFARAQFNMDPSWIIETREAPWHHDHPFSEDLYLTMLREVTSIYTSRESFQVVQLDSKDIFKYPFLYISEPGFMELTSKEVENFREYLNRGGFVMYDDFRGRDLGNLRYELKKVFPDREMFKLDVTHPVFHTFYDIDSLVMDPPYYDVRFMGGKPEFWGMNDDDGRLIMIANQNNDLGEFWQWVDEGQLDFKRAALSVRLGINYLVYAMTH